MHRIEPAAPRPVIPGQTITTGVTRRTFPTAQREQGAACPVCGAACLKCGAASKRGAGTGALGPSNNTIRSNAAGQSRQSGAASMSASRRDACGPSSNRIVADAAQISGTGSDTAGPWSNTTKADSTRQVQQRDDPPTSNTQMPSTRPSNDSFGTDTTRQIQQSGAGKPPAGPSCKKIGERGAASMKSAEKPSADPCSKKSRASISSQSQQRFAAGSNTDAGNPPARPSSTKTAARSPWESEQICAAGSSSDTVRETATPLGRRIVTGGLGAWRNDETPLRSRMSTCGDNSEKEVLRREAAGPSGRRIVTGRDDALREVLAKKAIRGEGAAAFSREVVNASSDPQTETGPSDSQSISRLLDEWREPADPSSPRPVQGSGSFY